MRKSEIARIRTAIDGTNISNSFVPNEFYPFEYTFSHELASFVFCFCSSFVFFSIFSASTFHSSYIWRVFVFSTANSSLDECGQDKHSFKSPKASRNAMHFAQNERNLNLFERLRIALIQLCHKITVQPKQPIILIRKLFSIWQRTEWNHATWKCQRIRRNHACVSTAIFRYAALLFQIHQKFINCRHFLLVPFIYSTFFRHSSILFPLRSGIFPLSTD